VPALPTQCFTDDGFFQTAGNVSHDVVLPAYQRQYDANEAIDKQLQALDAGTKQQRMMAFVQKDPMNAGRFIQESQMGAQRSGEMQTEVDNKRKALAERYKTLEAQYKSEFATTTDPLWTKFMNAQAPGAEVTVAQVKEYAAAFNAAYEKLCAKWWRGETPFAAYLRDFKTFEMESPIPLAEFGAKTKRQTLDIMGIPSAGYQSVGEQEAVMDYIKEAQKVYQLRFPAKATYP
jgi:hypothetical protein